MHLHGITLIAWCILLVLQPYLIRTKNYQLHRQVGKLSYVVVGLITLTTLDIYMYRLRGLDALSTQDYLSASSVLIALLTFLVFYGLAIFYKSKPGIHARYMVCTVFALFTAVFDRMIDSYFSFLLNYFPSVDGQPVRQVFGLTLADTIIRAVHMGLDIPPAMECFSRRPFDTSVLPLFRPSFLSIQFLAIVLQLVL